MSGFGRNKKKNQETNLKTEKHTHKKKYYWSCGLSIMLHHTALSAITDQL